MSDENGPHGSADPDEPDESHDIDAEFAAMMEGLELPSEMQADLAALADAGPDGIPEAAHDAAADDTDVSSSAGADESEDPEAVWEEPDESDSGVHTVSADDVPHNTYRAPDEAEEPALTQEQAAEIAALAAALGAAPSGGEGQDAGADADPTTTAKAVKVAVVLTPLASADALATLCRMSDLDCTVVPARSGAFAVKEFVSAHSEWDVSELLGDEDSEPAEAAELAASLSRLSRGGVVLLTADLATDVGIETGLSGTITARRYQSQKAGEEASAGLILAAVDQVVEDVLLGVTRAEDAPGAVRTQDVKPNLGMRFLGRGLRRPKGDSQD